MTTLTWAEVVGRATRALADAGIANAAAEARWIVEEASGLERTELAANGEVAVTRRTLAAFDAMLARRLEGTPLQYVLGSWAFRTLDLFVDERVLIPRPETELLVEVALAELARLDDAERDTRRAAPRALDLGTGSGAIGLALAAEHPRVEVLLTDRSDAALAVAAANLVGIGRAATRVSVAAGSWYEAVPAAWAGSVDLVLSNPPYVAESDDLPDEVREWEPTSALIAGPQGTECLAEVLAGAPTWLRAGGAVVVEMAPHQAEEVRDLAVTAGLRDVTVVDDLTGRARFVRALAP